MDEQKWIAWEIQTSRMWSDMEDVLSSTNIEFIDYDHIRLMEYALKLNGLLNKSEETLTMSILKETELLLTDLYTYARAHFEREEAFMDVYALPDILMHKREHKKILAVLEEAKAEFGMGKGRLDGRLKAQVMDWLLKHINVIDIEFFQVHKWNRNILRASSWQEIKPIIRMTGVTEIDHQHETMTELTIAGMERIKADFCDERIEVECKKISDYGLKHFSYEEGLMDKYLMRGVDHHKELHRYFIERMNEYKNRLKQKETDLDSMKSWIVTWWVEHINTIDRDCFEYKNWARGLIEKGEEIEDILVVLRLTGIKEIDEEHKRLMEMTLKLNQLVDQMGSGKRVSDFDMNMDEKREAFLNILEKTYSFSAAHFKREERIMELNQSKELETHREEHLKILKKLNDIRENYTNGRLGLSSNLKTMILDWWINHTNSVDYRTFVDQMRDIEIIGLEDDV